MTTQIVTGNEPQPDLDIKAFPGTDDYDPVAALMAKWEGKDDPNVKPSQDAQEEPAEGDVKVPEGDDTGDKEDASQEAPEGQEEAPAKEALKANDDDEIEVQVGDETRRVTVADLKALVAQKESIATETAAAKASRETADQEAARYAEGLGRAAQQAADNWAEYEKIDFSAAQAAMSPAEYAALKANSQKAWEAHQFFQKERGDFVQGLRQRALQDLQDRVAESKRALTDPASPFHIEGWGEPVYNEVRGFLVEQGAPEATVNMLVEPWAIKVAHMALKASKAAKALQQAPKAKPVVKTTATPSKTTEAPSSREDRGGREVDRAVQRLRSTGGVEDAAAVMAARWAQNDA